MARATPPESSEDRIRNQGIANKSVSADEAAALVTAGAHVGMSGFTGAGYPKAVPAALVAADERGEVAGVTVSPSAYGLGLRPHPSSTVHWRPSTASSCGCRTSPTR